MLNGSSVHLACPCAEAASGFRGEGLAEVRCVGMSRGGEGSGEEEGNSKASGPGREGEPVPLLPHRCTCGVGTCTRQKHTAGHPLASLLM
eukprot:1159892-Pelagomonas_calceolata.AAC.30